MSSTDQPARLRYTSYTFQVLSPGDHVVCAVTGQKIPLEDLKYWSLERQEPYVDATAATTAEMRWRKEQGLPA